MSQRRPHPIAYPRESLSIPPQSRVVAREHSILHRPKRRLGHYLIEFIGGELCPKCSSFRPNDRSRGIGLTRFNIGQTTPPGLSNELHRLFCRVRAQANQVENHSSSPNLLSIRCSPIKVRRITFRVEAYSNGVGQRRSRL